MERALRWGDFAVLDATFLGEERLIRRELRACQVFHSGFAVGARELVAPGAVLIGGE